jgi:hypothetical protein
MQTSPRRTCVGMWKKKVKYFIVMLTMTTVSPFSFAGGMKGATGPFMQTLATNFQSLMYSANDEIKRASVYELLGADGQNCTDENNNPTRCQWPNFPRVWYEQVDGKNFDTKIQATVDMKVSIPGVFEASGGVEIVPYNYSYGTEISLQVIGTRSLVDGASQGVDPVDKNPINGMGFESFTIMNYDNPARPQRFFRVVPGKPMVGFCSYRMALRKVTSQNAYGNMKVSFPGAIFQPSGALSTSNTSAQYSQQSIMLQSQFFQIEPNIPVEDYMNVKCKQQFLPKARPFVQHEFDMIVIEGLSTYQPGTQCLTTTEKTDDGDVDCFSWFYQTNHPTVQFATRPRCELDKNGIGRCKLKAKKDMPCTMYLDRNGNFTEKFHLYSEATASFISAPCDAGLKCSMDVNPWMIGPLIIWPGRASCK